MKSLIMKIYNQNLFCQLPHVFHVFMAEQVNNDEIH